jgi:two-component system OmpR family response regulator
VNAKLMSTVEFDGFAWDLRRRQLSTPQGALLTLSASELSLLMAFLQSGGRNLSREELLELVSRDGGRVGVRALDSHFSRLRRKLARHGGKGLISTVPGFGYRWAPPDAISEPAARVPRSFGAPFSSVPSSLPPASAS